MLYELVAVVRAGKLQEVKDIARTVGNVVLSRNGVVRGITNWGVFLLPKPLIHHAAKHHVGHYFVMRFDCSAQAQHVMRKTLGLDPRLLRYAVVKMGTTLDDIKDVGGTAEWSHEVD